MDIRQKQRCIIDLLNAEEISPIDIYKCLINVYGGERVDVSTVKRWVCRFPNGDRDVNNKSSFGSSSTATNEKNEARLDEPIKSNRRITVSEVSKKMEVSKGAVEKLISSLGYSKRWARLVPQMLIPEQKDHKVIVCK